MFECFFPDPRRFLVSMVVWALSAILFWHLFTATWLVATGWLYIYGVLCFSTAAAGWLLRGNAHKWARWSVGGSALTIFVTWLQVRIDVMINFWFGGFYDTIQSALAEPGTVTVEAYYSELGTFLGLAMLYVSTAVFNAFFTSHFVFRWRTAMNDRYLSLWTRIRHIEGAAQRVQEDTMRFAAIMETLGTRLVDAIITLLAFLPILWTLSRHIREVPVFGEISYALVWLALLWSTFGTALLAAAGYRLPGLEFRNQRVEAAFRKELVIGEDREDRAEPRTLMELYSDVRANYFRIYLNYLYFNVVRFSYLQAGVLLPYLMLGPTIVTAGFSLGVMQQILRAFGRVEDSFQFLVASWTTIVELASIYKRLAAFERSIVGEKLDALELETGGTRTSGIGEIQ